MHRTSITLALVALASLLSACELANAPAGAQSVDELCLQDGFEPCRDRGPTALQD